MSIIATINENSVTATLSGSINIDADTVGLLADLADPSKGAALVGFLQAGDGATARTAEAARRDFITVLDYGADPTGSTDSTAAFNLALEAATATTGNLDQPRREVFVPNGRWRIDGTIYVRKGQHLRGSGPGCFFDGAGRPGGGGPMVRMGAGDSGDEDPGGLAAWVSGIWFTTLASDAAIDTTGLPGWWISHCFFTGSSIGAKAGGGDGTISNCLFDVSLNGIVTEDCGNLLISACLFYDSNYGVRILGNSRDININGCHFEYMHNSGVFVGEGAPTDQNIKGIALRGNSFKQNDQHASTFEGFVTLAANALEVEVLGGNTFRNCYGAAIRSSTGVGCKLTVTDAVFDGKRTYIDLDGEAPDNSYTQSTTMVGIDASNMDVRVKNATFRDLPGAASVLFGGTVETKLSMSGCSFAGNAGTTEISITNPVATSRVDLSDVEGDDTRPLFNAQATLPVTTQGLKRWLGPVANASGRNYVLVPVQRANVIGIAIKANTAPGGSDDYRKASRFISVYGQDYNGSAQVEQVYTTEQAAFPNISGNPAFLPKIDLDVEIGSVGGGTDVAAAFPNLNHLAVSWPDTYANVALDVQLEV